MANLASIKCYRIPLPVVLSDSTHGEMRAFELNTVRLTDAEGAEGVGYTYTAGRNGAGIRAARAFQRLGRYRSCQTRAGTGAA
jgi:hypothetical protein